MKPKICIDCGKEFTPKSNRSVRCIPCQQAIRKRQKAKAKKAALSRRTLMGRALIKKDGNLEPISHRAHKTMSEFIRIIGQMAGAEDFEKLFPENRHDMKYENRKQKVYRTYKQGIPKWKIIKKFKINKNYLDEIINEMQTREKLGDDRNRIGESRTRETLLNDWLKISNQYKKDEKWDIERDLDELLKDVTDNQLFEYEKYTSAFDEVKKRATIDRKIVEEINIVVKSIEKLRDELLEEIDPDELPQAFWTPIRRLVEYRMRKKLKNL